MFINYEHKDQGAEMRLSHVSIWKIKTHSSDKVRYQSGISLFVVLVVMLLVALLALWASRASIFNELVVGNDVDYQRAFEAAQSLIQDAELDIRGETSTGGSCVESGESTHVCRKGTSIPKIPIEVKELNTLFIALERERTKCKHGLCLKRVGKQDFWNNSDAEKGATFQEFVVQNVGARYGQFTGAKIGDGTNALLTERGGNKGGWYWVEVMPYMEAAGNASLIVGGATQFVQLNMRPQIIYRITAIVYGRKKSTMVVIQQIYARQRLLD